jgi:hypothetical protein
LLLNLPTISGVGDFTDALHEHAEANAAYRVAKPHP